MPQNAASHHETTADVGALRIARVYAEALLNAADKRGEADAILEELDSLVQDILAADGSLAAFLASPAVPHKEKAEAIQSTFGPRAGELFTNFLLVLNDHRRLELLRHIRSAYRDLLDERRNRVRVAVRSAVPLTDEQRQRVARMVGEAMHLEPILETDLDPALLGGLVVRVRDWQYDGSLRTRLDSILNQILERSSHEIQRRRDHFSSDA